MFPAGNLCKHHNVCPGTFLCRKRSQKPLLFAHLPTKLICNKAELEKIKHSSRTQSISLQLTDQLAVSGQILENLTTSTGVKNINIRLSNFGDALFHISIFPQSDGTNKIAGRIIHPGYGDALVISEENGRYYITRHKMEFFMVE